MSLASDFRIFCDNIQLDNLSDMKKTAGDIAKKLNAHYYDLDGDSESHMYIVGSVGRKTAIAGSSDLDILFDMPDCVYTRYNNYESKGQTALIQDVKEVLKEKYPKTDLRGDGQVVVINFNKYTVELVPGFKQLDDKFKYPDTNDGGRWKYTDPLSEQSECEQCNSDSTEIYYDFCHAIRSWKNKVGIEMGGLLVDTLVYNFFQDNGNFSDCDTNDYLNILSELFIYLKNQNPDQSYWLAIGSNQQVSNSGTGAFVSKAKKAHEKLDGTTETTKGINDMLRELLGSNFPKAEEKKEKFEQCSFEKKYDKGTVTEKFIEELVPVDIRYRLWVDCNVTQDGWRPFLLRTFLRENNGWLKHNKYLDFYVAETNCPAPYQIWWKVRNVGVEAVNKKMIRGNIDKTNSKHQYEHTCFAGSHYVECFLVKNNICVARDRIDVPIGSI